MNVLCLQRAPGFLGSRFEEKHDQPPFTDRNTMALGTIQLTREPAVVRRGLSNGRSCARRCVHLRTMAPDTRCSRSYESRFNSLVQRAEERSNRKQDAAARTIGATNRPLSDTRDRRCPSRMYFSWTPPRCVTCFMA